MAGGQKWAQLHGVPLARDPGPQGWDILYCSGGGQSCSLDPLLAGPQCRGSRLQEEDTFWGLGQHLRTPGSQPASEHGYKANAQEPGVQTLGPSLCRESKSTSGPRL